MDSEINNCLKKIDSLSKNQKAAYYELMGHELTIIIRSIWSDQVIDPEEKLERIKWINEIQHRIISKISHLRREIDWDDSDIMEMIHFYIEKKSEIRQEVYNAILRSLNVALNKEK
ncbi:hypothetical protein EHQ58_03760 [Leptospira ognonensis]|uniref:Uncharacterized protein n=1 Tax=Leptospira ognonensis TaxID=2484945 RepID=A0A4V6QM79_9LEPT|nr:hypothetical protein [Leptospira ognonensis]TGL62041.1 hypothetical protein EHQ58_03760 [Leptospira ognonensis]